MKSFVYIGAVVGGIIGGYVPALFGNSAFSGWAIFTSLVGGLAGIWAGYKIQDNMDL